MATNLHIDEKLLREAVKLGKHQTKRDAVNTALREYVQHQKQLGIFKVFGTLEDEDFWDPPHSPKQTHGSRRNGNGR